MDAIKTLFRRVSVYRVTLYFLIAVLALAAALSEAGVLPYRAGDILLQAGLFVAVSWGANALAAYFLKIRTKPESAIITGLILACIMGPLAWEREWFVIIAASAAAIGSKYLFAIRHRHIFNPAACGAVVSALVLGYPASWWVGSVELLPIVFLGGILGAVKLRRLHLAAAFLCFYTALVIGDSFFLQGGSGLVIFTRSVNLLASSPLIFFALIMLIEPMTAPPSRRWGIAYGAFAAAVLFLFQRFLFEAPFLLEASLLAANLLAAVANPFFRLSPSRVKGA